eukprot:TRINITY_DN1044_c0_g1_i4.p1 TRINITY_DN1044_c0_g1~~TRINITY_DN1044_c0_g1_i4.p1  ORF type:complete len:1267 (-),score=234.72 TRINITY_DN1044_c0_g1_i4:554-4354(-)
MSQSAPQPRRKGSLYARPSRFALLLSAKAKTRTDRCMSIELVDAQNGAIDLQISDESCIAAPLPTLMEALPIEHSVDFEGGFNILAEQDDAGNEDDFSDGQSEGESHGESEDEGRDCLQEHEIAEKQNHHTHNHHADNHHGHEYHHETINSPVLPQADETFASTLKHGLDLQAEPTLLSETLSSMVVTESQHVAPHNDGNDDLFKDIPDSRKRNAIRHVPASLFEDDLNTDSAKPHRAPPLFKAQVVDTVPSATLASKEPRRIQNQQYHPLFIPDAASGLTNEPPNEANLQTVSQQRKPLSSIPSLLRIVPENVGTLSTILTAKEAADRLPDAVGKFLGLSLRASGQETITRSAKRLLDIVRDICCVEDEAALMDQQDQKAARTASADLTDLTAAAGLANPVPIPLILNPSSASRAAHAGAWVQMLRFQRTRLLAQCRAASQSPADRYVQQLATSAAKALKLAASFAMEAIEQQGMSGGTVVFGSPLGTPSTHRRSYGGSTGEIDVASLCKQYMSLARIIEDRLWTSPTLAHSNLESTDLTGNEDLVNSMDGMDALKAIFGIASDLTCVCMTLASTLVHRRHRGNMLEWAKQLYIIPTEVFGRIRSRAFRRMDAKERQVSDYIPQFIVTHRSARIQLIAELELRSLVSMLSSTASSVVAAITSATDLLPKQSIQIAATSADDAQTSASLDSQPQSELTQSNSTQQATTPTIDEETRFLLLLRSALHDVTVALNDAAKTLRSDQPPIVVSAAGYDIALRLHNVLLCFSGCVATNTHFARLAAGIENTLPHIMAGINTLEQDDRLRTSDGSEPSVFLQIVGVVRPVIQHISMIVQHVLNASPDTRYSVSISKKKIIHDEAADINIWSEKQVDESANRGTLNALIRALTSDKTHDPMFLKACIMTYQSFTTTEKFFSKLMERYHVPQTEEYPDEESFKKAATSIKLRVCQVIQNWLETHFSDASEDVFRKLNEFIDVTLISDNLKNVSQKLKSTIEKKVNRALTGAPYVKEDALKYTENSYLPLKIMQDFPIAEIARQLTLIDFEVYSSIQPVEFLNQAWNVAKYKYRAPNLLYYIQRFNTVSKWVASCILWHEDVNSRALMWARMVSLAEQFKELNNFQLLMAVISGLNTSAVHRLKFTREEIPKRSMEVFTSLEELMSSESSFKRYRETLHNCQPPCMPYIGIYLTDLTHIEDGNPTIIDGQINFEKLKLVFRVISEIRQYQYGTYGFPKSSTLAPFLTLLPHLEDDALYRISTLREPRGAERSDIS